MIELNKTYLVTTDGWFQAPDGQNYKAVFGTVKAICNDEDSLGIKTNDRSTNWYLVIGKMIIAGCQVHYAIQTDICSFKPYLREVECGGRVTLEEVITRIYNADE